MITQLMTFEAESASARYKTLIEGWRGLFMASLGNPRFGAGDVLPDLLREARAMAVSYLNTELRLVGEQTQKFAAQAHTDALSQLGSIDSSELTDVASEHLDALESYLSSEIAIQIERDIAFLRQSYLRVVLQVKLAARSQRTTLRAALLQYRIGNAVELNFFFHDRRNQRWPSQKFVRAIWRHHLLATYNETFLIDLSEHGIRQAQVEHVNPGSQFHGMQIALSPNGKLPTYPEIRNEIFHPNADAVVRAPESI